MADFGGFEIEDDIQEPSPAGSFGGFEIEDDSPEVEAPSPAPALKPEQPAATPSDVRRQKVERSKSEIMALEWQAQTGQRDGAGRYAFSSLVPFAGGDFEQTQKDRLSRMKDFVDGKPRLQKRVVDGREMTPEQAALGRSMFYDPNERRDTLDDMMADEAAYLLGANLPETQRRDDESRKDYEARLKSLVGDRLKDTVAAQKEAQQKLSDTDKTITDKIVVGGLPSIRYVGEMAAGGTVMKGAQGAKLGFNLLTKAGMRQLFTREGAKNAAAVAGRKLAVDAAKSMPATVAGTVQGSRELARDEYGLDSDGNVVVTAEGDKGNTLGKAFRNSFTENLLENLVGEVSRPLAGKMFGKIGKTGKIGRAVSRVYNAYNRITDVTGFGDVLFEELPEENVQYFFSDILGWGKKDSEFRGVMDELRHAFTDDGGQYTLGGQWNTALAMIMQMGAQTALAAGKAGKDALVERIDEKRDLGAQLQEKCGLMPEQVGRMNLAQRRAFADVWNTMRNDPDAMKDALEKAGGFLGEQADELTRQSTDSLWRDISGYGEKPHRFMVQTDAEGNLQFEPSDELDETAAKVVQKPSMTDTAAGVTILDNGDGTYDVRDNLHPEREFSTDDFGEAQRCADFYSLTNQKRRLDNAIKSKRAVQMAQETEQAAEVVDNMAALFEKASAAIEQNGEFHGVTDLSQMFQSGADGKVTYPPTLALGNDTKGFRMPDGTICAVLDNIATLEEMYLVFHPDEPAFKDGVNFQDVTEKDIDGNDVTTRMAVDKVHGKTIIDARDGTYVVFDNKGGYAQASSPEEAVAVANGAEPKPVIARGKGANETRADEAPAQPVSEQPTSVVQAESKTAKPVKEASKTDASLTTPAPAEGSVATAPSVDKTAPAPAPATAPAPTASKPVEKAPTSASTPPEAQSTPTAEKPVEAASRASDETPAEQTPAPAAEEQRKAVEKKAKRDATRAATLERANAVQPPSWMGKSAGPAATRVSDLVGYLADNGHNRASLHKAVQSVRSYIKKHGGLALSKNDKAALADALANAGARLAKMKADDQAAFGERNAELPTSLVRRYVEEKNPASILADFLENGRFFTRPRSARAAKRAVGVKNPVVDARYDGKLFDPDSEGGDELNLFFDGMNQTERNRWARILFGAGGEKEVVAQTPTGNDAILDRLGMDMGEALAAIRDEVAAFQEWRKGGAESDEERYYREQYEAEQAALDEEFGPIDQFRIDELEAREGADKEYAAAKAFVENKATAKDIAVYSPSALSAAEEGDAIRIDHQKKAYEFSGYDAKNGILYVNDFVEVETGDAAGVVREPRRFRVTEDGFAEIKEVNENGNRRTDETRPADNGASDAQGARNGRGAEEAAAGSSAGSVVRTAENAAGAREKEVRRAAYNRLKNALDPEWRARHPEEVAKLEAEGVDVSAVASNPNVSGTDKISWPITATRIGSREDAANIFRLIADPGKEITKVLYLGEDGNIVGSRIVAVGLVGTTPANIDAVLENVPKDTYGIVFSHNHPAEQGDDIMPSMDDLMLTSVTLKPMVEKAGLKLLDHIITDHNAYLSIGALRDGHYASDGAAEFWDKAKALSEFFDESVAKPEDRMNIVPFGERINLVHDTEEKLGELAYIASKVHDKSSWVVGIDSKANVVWVASLPKGGDTAAFLAAHPGAMRFAVLNGENAIDMPSFINAIEQEWKKKIGGDERSRPLVVAVGSNGKLADYDPHGLNDKILNAAKPVAPAKPAAPRLANAPKLNDKASKAIDDILGEMGSLLRAPVEPLSLSREEERKFRDAVERMVETLADNGFNTFDNLARVVASRRPDIYTRAKDLLRRSWNFIARDPADEITIARGNEIFGIIDGELQPKETTNDLGTDAVDAGQRDGAQDNGGERNTADRGLSVPAGTGDGGAGKGPRRPGGGERSAAPVRAGAGELPVDVREDGGQRGGDGGDVVGQRAVGLERRDGGHGEVQRDSKGAVPRVGEEVSPGFTAYEPPSDLPIAAPKSRSLIVEPSALADMPQPPIKSKPDIPDSIPKNGVLQAHQYEAVCRAVDSNNKTLPDGRRQGFFVGDGTGAGKTRIIAGVMLDAMNRNLGKGKALIISKNKDLYEGALGDFEPFGISGKLFDLTDAKWKSKLEKNGKGIAFVTYPSLAENYVGTDGDGSVRSAGKRGKSLNRYEEIVKWLGKDFDGVIALDEAHSASKDDGSARRQAKRSQAVIDLQNALPKARVLYLTATAAYDAKDLRFLTRMGLWGEGTSFRTFNDFADMINRAGLTMMEVLTQGMKAAGKYCSRSISFKGVNCKRVVAKVSPEQKRTYSVYSSALSRIHDVAMSLEGVTGAPRKYLSAQYFGRALDIFNSLITSMKVGKAIELGRQAIAEGKSPVFQLISTNDSAKDAKKTAAPTRKEYDMFGNVIREVPVEDASEVEASVKDRIVNFLRGGGFPVREYLGMEGGHMQWGEEVPEAVALRDEMIALVESLPDVGNPIDEIVKAFSDVGISRITSRSNKNAEAAAFNNGENLALVFSGAGGTGASYHADKRFKNKRQRVQIPIEFGWEPDKFIQALGRSHRNNQVVPPEFVLLTTDIAGEMRFMSTIANRVASMGAIVGGDRNSSGQVVSSGDSLQNEYGSAAIRDVMRKLLSGRRIGEMSAQEVLDAMFMRNVDLDEIKPTQILGRLQFLPVDEQSAIYSEIASHMEKAIAQAKADGTYDDGIRKIDAKRLSVVKRESMSTGENEGQNRDLLTVSEWYDSPRIDHAAVEARVPNGQSIEYVRNKRSGKLYALISRSDGAFARLAPNGSYETVAPLERNNYTVLADKESARKAWDDEYAAIPAEEEKVRHYMSGDLIPVWDKIGIDGRPYVYRAAPSGEKPFVGLYISDAQMPITLYGFGKKDEARKLFKENAYRLAAREGVNIGVGAQDDLGRQPYFKRAKIGGRYVLAAYQAPVNAALENELADGGWISTWAKDDSNSEDRGGTVYYRELGDAAKDALNAIVDKYGSAAYHGKDVVFESKDGVARRAAEETPQRQGVSERPALAGTLDGQSPRRYRPDLVQTGAVRGNLRERVGMPQMRMRVQNGELVITNTDSRRKNDLKLAFGGKWANRVRDGKRYVKSDLTWNKTLDGGYWSIPLEKIPPSVLAEIEGEGVLNAPVAPLTSVDKMNATGGLVRLAQNPDEFKSTFMYNLLRAEVAPLSDPKDKAYSEQELLRRAADDGDMAALGELYNRYMGPNAKNGGLVGLIRRAAVRKGMAGVMNESRIEDVASLVWAGTPVDGRYENNRSGIIADFNNGDTAIYKNAKSLIPVMTTKIDRILNDMAERATNRPEMQTLDAPSRTREGESELDQQIADDSGVAEGLLGGDAANEYVEDADDTVEDVVARKLGDIEGAFGERRLSRGERNRKEAMDMLDQTMRFLPPDLQDAINAILTEERMRGWIDPEREKEKRVAKASFANAQKKSGLSPRVFGYRYRTAKDLLNEIWHNIKNGKSDSEIKAIANEVVRDGESEAVLNDEILRRIDEREPESDMTLAVRLLLRGESVADVADFFEINPAMVRAWKARARNEHGITFPDEEVNPLGLGDFPERKSVKRGGRAQKSARPQTTAWTPDLFAAANATVDDQQNFKIEEGIAANAPDEQIAREANVAPEIVKLARIRQGSLYFGDEASSPAAPRQKTEGERTRDLFADLPKKQTQDFLFAPVEPLEQGTLGIEAPTAEEIFGYTNAAMNEWRSERGFNELAKGAKVSLDALHRQGAAMANNIDEMKRMVERLEKAPYAVNAVDQVALGQFIAKMEGEYNDLARLKAEQHANGNESMAIQTDMEMDELFKWLDRAQRVNKKTGEIWGRTGRARQLAIDKAGNLADYMISCAERKGSPLTKSEKAQAELLFKTFSEAQKKYDNLTMDDIIAQLDALSKIRLARQQDGIKERRGKYTPEQIERDYAEALAQIRYHGEHRSGGTLHGLPNGQKWIRSIEAYHLMNGEGLTDGKPDGAKMAQFVLDDILAQGVDATLWDVRQMESRMGNLIKPSQDEISKSLRDLHAQMLVEQQIEHIVSTGELPPKTGMDRDEDSAAARSLRRIRDRIIREKGISRKSSEEQLKSALDAYKRRLQNQIEDNEKAIADIEAGLPYEPQKKTKLQLDDEAQALKERNKELKNRIAELTRDPAKEHDKRVILAMDALAKRIAVRKEQLENAKAQGAAYDFDGQKPQKLEDARLDPMREELDRLNKEFKALKKALYPDGTDAEIARKLDLRLAARQKQLDRWNKMAADYKAADTWAERWAAVAPTAKRPPLESEATLKAAKERDAARKKVLEYREKLKNEQDRLYPVKAWARFIGGTSVLARAIYDMSAVGIQGGKYLRSHPVKATKIAAKATKAFFTQKSADVLAAEIKAHPYFEDFENNGGHIYKMDGLEGDVPEDFRVVEQGVRLPGGKMITAESIPGVKRSNRSFAGFLNRAALELYADMVEAAGPDGAGATDAQKKLIADFVNISLGYGYGKKGASGKLGLVPAVLDAIAWAPRKAVAELKYATGWNLLGSLNTRKNEISGKEIWNVDKAIGREYLRYTLGSLAFGACLLLLAKLINGDDDDDKNRWSDMLDPRSAEFGRVSIGNTRYSVFAGNEMVWRLFARLYTGQTKANGVVKDYRYHGIEAALNYLRGKLNPIYSAAVDVKMGENFVGEKLSDKSGFELASNYLLPLTANALYENFAKNPDDPLAAIFNAAPTFFGMTSSTYERDPLARVVAQGNEAIKRAKAAEDDESADRIGARLDERGEVYGAAKEALALEKKLKNLEAQAKTFKYTIDRSKDGGSPQLRKNYADVMAAIEELKPEAKVARDNAMKVYRDARSRGTKWNDMGWTE